MFFALTLLTVDALLVAVAFAYIWLALIPAWVGNVVRRDIDPDHEPAIPLSRGAAALETLRQRRLPAHRRHAIALFTARSAR